MAERNASLLRRRLRSAERFSDRAMLRGSSREKTPRSRSRALLFAVTRWDQRLRAPAAMLCLFPILQNESDLHNHFVLRDLLGSDLDFLFFDPGAANIAQRLSCPRYALRNGILETLFRA